MSSVRLHCIDFLSISRQFATCSTGAPIVLPSWPAPGLTPRKATIPNPSHHGSSTSPSSPPFCSFRSAPFPPPATTSSSVSAPPLRPPCNNRTTGTGQTLPRTAINWRKNSTRQARGYTSGRTTDRTTTRLRNISAACGEMEPTLTSHRRILLTRRRRIFTITA